MSQMTANGCIQSDSPSTFTAIFMLTSGQQATFIGSFVPSVQTFICDTATLTYTNEDDLISSRDFSGPLGSNDFTLTFTNNVIISGTLNQPIFPPNNIAGDGFWTIP
ncbi:hypothetical protein JR316_0006610 [Psilocybe cubensis]|uniref:Uncharacterized protein n=2 Tax=Psilocybe cubensis TaxID=181762 RepID=A0A8H7XHY6_PSICU|nr:hypothetical protein JR316_0006610 [Psilocybe cubensis]KAH9480013.1 hypothetical protein JR316_0006610 [Psilocybe cubensis]